MLDHTMAHDSAELVLKVITYGMDIMYLAGKLSRLQAIPGVSKLNQNVAVPIGLGRHMIMLSYPAVIAFTKVAMAS